MPLTFFLLCRIYILLQANFVTDNQAEERDASCIRKIIAANCALWWRIIDRLKEETSRTNNICARMSFVLLTT